MRHRLALAGMAVLALAGCSSGPDVRVEYDRAAAFDTYKYFAFETPLGTDREGYQGAVSRYLTASTRRELESRGMQYRESAPDVRVNFSARLTEKLSIEAPAPIEGGYYGYRRGSYSTWSGYAWNDPAMRYTEGTLNVDVIDVARKQLVWEGVVVGVVTEAKLADLQASIDDAVKAAFAKYPKPAAK